MVFNSTLKKHQHGVVVIYLLGNLNVRLYYKLRCSVLFMVALDSPRGPFHLWVSVSLCSKIPQCCRKSCVSKNSFMPAFLQATHPTTSVRKERKRNLSFTCVLMKYLLSLSLCSTVPLMKISFLHLHSFLNILFCYETARWIYIIKFPKYFIALVFCFLFWCGLGQEWGQKQMLLKLSNLRRI